MSGYTFANGATGVILRVQLSDSSQTIANNLGLGGLTFSSTGLIISTICDNEASATAYTQAGGTIQGIATLGTFAAPSTNNCRFKEIDSTNFKGLYEIQLANARFAVAGAKYLYVGVPAVAGLNLAQMPTLCVPLQAIDPYNIQSIWTSAMTESYSTNASTSTAAQALYEIKSALQNFAIAGTTITFKKIDGSTTSMTGTLNSASTPTSLARAS